MRERRLLFPTVGGGGTREGVQFKIRLILMN
jgi:hypothetical protein